jgi:hypothetical protein
VSLLAETSGLASGRSESSALAVLVDRVDDPVDARVVTDLLMGRVNHDDLVVLVDCILVDPVGVEDAHVGVFASHLLLGNTLQVALELEVVDTLVLGLTEDHTTVVLTLTSTTTNSNTNYHVSLLGLVPETVSLFRTSRSVDTGHFGALTVLPRTNTKKKSQSITLLVTPKLFHILVSTHLSSMF